MPQGTSVATIVANVCASAKVDMINDLPAMPVSGDIGCGFFCVPASIDDLAWLSHVPAAGRPNVLSFALRGAMQKAQAALKAFDKKNKDASDEKRLDAAQTAFAGALNGAVASSFNDSSLITSEATRLFIDAKVKPWAAGKGLDSSPESLEQYRAAIEKDNASAYPGWIDALKAQVIEKRTYAVNRKGSVDGVKVETNDFAF